MKGKIGDSQRLLHILESIAEIENILRMSALSNSLKTR